MSGVVPFTIVFVAKGNKVMMARWRELTGADGKRLMDLQSKERLEEARSRVGRWAILTYCRAFLPFAGAVVAWTTW